jgi:hypothetical protein
MMLKCCRSMRSSVIQQLHYITYDAQKGSCAPSDGDANRTTFLLQGARVPLSFSSCMACTGPPASNTTIGLLGVAACHRHTVPSLPALIGMPFSSRVLLMGPEKGNQSSKGIRWYYQHAVVRWRSATTAVDLHEKGAAPGSAHDCENAGRQAAQEGSAQQFILQSPACQFCAHLCGAGRSC